MEHNTSGCHDEDAWFFLDAFDGSPARCTGESSLECAGNAAGDGCQWGRLLGKPMPYQRLSGVAAVPCRADAVSGAQQNLGCVLPCGGVWPTNDGSDPCVELGCYNNTNNNRHSLRCRAPAIVARSSWIVSVFMDGSGHISFSRNYMREDIGSFLFAATAIVVAVMGCFCALVRPTPRWIPIRHTGLASAHPSSPHPRLCALVAYTVGRAWGAAGTRCISHCDATRIPYLVPHLVLVHSMHMCTRACLHTCQVYFGLRCSMRRRVLKLMRTEVRLKYDLQMAKVREYDICGKYGKYGKYDLLEYTMVV